MCNGTINHRWFVRLLDQRVLNAAIRNNIIIEFELQLAFDEHEQVIYHNAYSTQCTTHILFIPRVYLTGGGAIVQRPMSSTCSVYTLKINNKIYAQNDTEWVNTVENRNQFSFIWSISLNLSISIYFKLNDSSVRARMETNTLHQSKPQMGFKEEIFNLETSYLFQSAV